MTNRFVVCGVILVALTACGNEPQTFSYSQDLKKEVKGPGISNDFDVVGQATIELSAKFDRAPHGGQNNVGVAYYRVDISNPSDYRLSVGDVFLQFVDEMEISIKKCKLKSADINPYGLTPIRIEPGKIFSTSSSCEFPISQMDLVREISSLVDFNFWE